MSLLIIAQQLMIYGGIFEGVVGLIGNGINILVFSSVQQYRRTPTGFYFLIASVFNISYLIINLPFRILIAGFGNDITTTSLLYCKIRPFFLTTLCLISLNCSCLATIDQFFTTSQNAWIRNLSSIKWSHRIIVFVILIWCLHGIPFLIYFNISPITHLCISTSTHLAIYFPAIYILTLNCVIPAAIMILFGYLAYNNIQKTRVLVQHQVDRQLTRMVLINVLLVITSYVPYGIDNSYLLITSDFIKDKNRLLLENLFGVIVSLLCYSYFAASCYMFLISSSRFRREVKEKLFFWRTQNLIAPLESSQPKTKSFHTEPKK
ncbi:unnamed protein product [Adineta steineri]|uniref:G-protein coupled receptors family 1 profile domain-containing protein n=1 Tax=Adineta steineri TaxID=433720 RepID=A0A816FXP4_9BILA|nr:unnamed protein product [Adineta steineri]CAF1667495.1 unnamed protein product [Adineta steineri]